MSDSRVVRLFQNPMLWRCAIGLAIAGVLLNVGQLLFDDSQSTTHSVLQICLWVGVGCLWTQRLRELTRRQH